VKLALNKSIKHILKSKRVTNSLWSIGELVIYSITMLIATRYFLTYFGPEKTGIFQLINIQLLIMNLLNLGIGESLQKNIAYLTSNNQVADNKSTQTVFSSGLAVAILIGLSGAALAITGTLLYAYYVGSIPQLLLLTIITGSILFIFKQIESVYLNTLKGLQNYRLFAICSFSSRVVALAANIAIAYYTGNFFYLLISTVAVLALSLGFQTIVFRKKLPFSLRPATNLTIIKDLFKYGVWVWLQNLTSIIASQLDKLIIVGALGFISFTYYNIGITLIGQIHLLFVVGTNWIVSEVASYSADRSVKKLYTLAQGIVVFLGSCIIVVVFSLKYNLIQLWLGASADISAILRYLQYLLVYELLLLYTIVPFQTMNGSKFVRLNTISESMIKALCLIMMAMGFTLMGDQGIVFGLIVAMFIGLPLQAMVFNRFVLNRSIINGLTNVIPTIAVALVLLIDSMPLQIILVILAAVFFYTDYIKRITWN
jgi:O-antigen/teichoic acid export membrane protein